MLKKQKRHRSLTGKKGICLSLLHTNGKDNRIYKVATWIIILLFAMLQPLGQYESLPDDVTSFDNCEMQFCQQGSTCIDEDTTPYAPSATRLRHQTTSASGPSVIQRHVSSLSVCSGRKPCAHLRPTISAAVPRCASIGFRHKFHPTAFILSTGRASILSRRLASVCFT